MNNKHSILSNTVITVIVILLSLSIQIQAKDNPINNKNLNGGNQNDVAFSDGFEGLLLGPDPQIITANAKLSFIANSFMGAYGGVNNYLELIVNESVNPMTLNTIPARIDSGGWYWGMGLSQMTSALDRIESEGDYDSCIFLDGSMQTMREFADRLFVACDKVILFADAGYHNPVSLGGSYLSATATTLANARQMQVEYPELVVVPTAYVFYELTTNPVVNVPRLDYLYGDDNIHQNGLGTLVNAYSLYSVFSSRSPLGLGFEFDQPATENHSFMSGGFILLGHNFPSDTPDDKLLFDEFTQHLFQQRVIDLLVEWQQGNTTFD